MGITQHVNVLNWFVGWPVSSQFKHDPFELNRLNKSTQSDPFIKQVKHVNSSKTNLSNMLDIITQNLIICVQIVLCCIKYEIFNTDY